MIGTLKRLFGGTNMKTNNYGCSECEAKFAIPEDEPVECPECESAEFVYPEQNILLNNHQCNDCNERFTFPEEVEVICPDCDSTSVRTVQ